MDSKKIVENIFIKYGIEWEVKEFDKYINPKCKTAASIYSKLVRLYSGHNNRTEFTILNSGIKDLLRMTIIVEYSEVVSIIQKLKKSFPDLTGYVNNKKSGYRGVHLNMKIDGIPCEIQLTPKIVAMGVDYLHTLHKKWRDFDSSKELRILEQRKQKIINSNISIQEKYNLLKIIEDENDILEGKIQDEKKDLELRNKTYGEVFEAARLSVYQDEIENKMNELKEYKEESLPLSNPNLINIFNRNLLTDGEIDKDKVDEVTKQLLKYLEIEQDKFVESIKKCLQL